MAELSEACRKHLAARWDDGSAAIDDKRFDKDVSTGNTAELDIELNVIELDVEDMLDFPELCGYTAVAISQDSTVVYLTKEEADDGDKDG